MSGPNYKFHKDSQFRAETDEWSRDKLRAEESRWFKERQWCRCRKPVEGPVYLKHRSCRACGKLQERKRP